MWSPPNFSRQASPTTSATIASATTAAAGTVQESVRSRSACAGSLVSVSTEPRRHTPAGVQACTPNRGLVHVREAGRRQVVAPRSLDGADREHVAEHLDAQAPQEALRNGAAGHAGGGVARARALEHVAHVGE